MWDYGTPLEETLETLHWLVQEGKVDQVNLQKANVQWTFWKICPYSKFEFKNSVKNQSNKNFKIKVQFQVRYVGGSNMTGWQLQLASSLAKKEGFAKYSVLQQQWVFFYSCLKSLQDYMKLFKVQPALQRAWVGGAGGGCQGGGWHPSLESPQGQQDAVKKFFSF